MSIIQYFFKDSPEIQPATLALILENSFPELLPLYNVIHNQIYNHLIELAPNLLTLEKDQKIKIVPSIGENIDLHVIDKSEDCLLISLSNKADAPEWLHMEVVIVPHQNFAQALTAQESLLVYRQNIFSEEANEEFYEDIEKTFTNVFYYDAEKLPGLINLRSNHYEHLNAILCAWLAGDPYVSEALEHN